MINHFISTSLINLIIQELEMLDSIYHMTLKLLKNDIFSSPEPKAQGELIVWDSSQPLCVHPCVRPSILSNMNISETNWPIIIKFHQEYHWGGGLTALGFG